MDWNKGITLIKNILQYTLWVGVVFGATYWGVSKVHQMNAAQEEAQAVQAEPYWDTDLEVCNSAEITEENSDFEQCLALAEQGRVYAQMRVAYLYFTSENEDHLQESYNWMKKAGDYLEEPLLLSKIMLLTYGTSESDKQRGYKGIVRLSDEGYAGADAYLAVLYYLQENLSQRMANPLWLLEKSYQSGDGFVLPMDLVKIYINGFGTQSDLEKAAKLLFDYADQDFPLSANNTAWFMATTDNLPFNQPEKAVELALSVVEDERYERDYPYIDTLAAAYAAAGNFEKAIEQQERAIQILKESGTEEDKLDLDDFQSRLAQFKENKVAIYDDIKVESSVFFENMKERLESSLLGSLKYATYP